MITVFKLDYDFLSDDSMVLKVITIYNKDTDSMEEVLLEELQVFKVLYFEVHSVRANSAECESKTVPNIL